MNKTKVTVFMTAYNREKYVKEALAAVLNQTLTDYKVVVLDNCSTDGTSEIIDEFDDPRLTHIRHAENIGGAANGSKAFEMADTEYFVLTHDDDVMEPNFLQRELAVMEKNPQAAIVETEICFIDKNGNRVPRKTASADIIYKQNEFVKAYFEQNIRLSCPTIMFRTAFIKEKQMTLNAKCGGYNDQLLYCEINAAGGEIYSISDPLYRYRVHEDQDSYSTYVNLEKREDDLEKKFLLGDIVFSGIDNNKKDCLRKSYALYNARIFRACITGLAKGEISKEYFLNQKNRQLKLFMNEAFSKKTKVLIFLAERLPKVLRAMIKLKRRTTPKTSFDIALAQSIKG